MDNCDLDCECQCVCELFEAFARSRSDSSCKFEGKLQWDKICQVRATLFDTYESTNREPLTDSLGAVLSSFGSSL